MIILLSKNLQKKIKIDKMHTKVVSKRKVDGDYERESTQREESDRAGGTT